MAYTRTYNPCDDCQYAYSKNGQESSLCKICEFEELRTADVVPKSEVAREIFEEIEELLREWFDFFRQDNCIRESCAIMAALSQVSERKKKYT